MSWGKRSFGHKYGAQKTIVDGVEFGSKLEAAVYQILKLREKAGEISDIQLQDTVTLKSKCEACGDGPVRWKVDFSFIKNSTGQREYAEAKGVHTSTFRKQLRLWKSNPPTRLEIWKGSYESPRLVEIIEKEML